MLASLDYVAVGTFKKNCMRYRMHDLFPGPDWLWGWMGTCFWWTSAWQGTAFWGDRRRWTVVYRADITWRNDDAWQGMLLHAFCYTYSCLTWHCKEILRYTGWFRRKGQYFGRSLWDKKFTWTYVEVWMFTEITAVWLHRYRIRRKRNYLMLIFFYARIIHLD